MHVSQDVDSPLEPQGTIIPEFKIYNRYQELERRERERKEQAWERELELAMSSSDPLKEETEPREKIHKCTGCPKLESMINSNCKLKKCDQNDSFGEKDDSRKGNDSNTSQLHPPPSVNQTKKSEDKTGLDDIQNKLQNIDFIDRTPSPVERVEGT